MKCVENSKENTVEPPCATTSRKQLPPVSDHFSKILNFSSGQINIVGTSHRQPQPLLELLVEIVLLYCMQNSCMKPLIT